jgi:hypothetical protein
VSEISCVQKLISPVLAISSFHSALLVQKFFFRFIRKYVQSRIPHPASRIPHPASMRGAFRDRHEREAGSGGRDGVG